ncbi:virB8 family protein [Tabrizicola oligotrophica]|uniref:Type IV secretion system protein n=1 Tax=Tabrizicola oligotrophica TaxID=2710650 RepID=A0A6M0QXA4_9RHOB|nr:type IV secretion system protein [Tabrizicola oligotrophica]NEY92017.1 type IV secretion system protein [Tabrizicola oligotrophica]
MKDTTHDTEPLSVKSFLEEEMAFGIRRRERIAWIVASAGVATGLLGIAAVVLILPLKQTEAYLAIVDKDTGVAERVVSVEKAGVDQAEGIKQSLLYSYVIDRETFDAHDNEARILQVYARSEGAARKSLVTLWNEGNETYPPKVYGASAKATVAITSITPITETTYQVRYTKTLARDADPERVGKFYATVTFRFAPAQQSAISLVWENPTGFIVTDYRVTAETFEAEQ